MSDEHNRFEFWCMQKQALRREEPIYSEGKAVEFRSDETPWAHNYQLIAIGSQKCLHENALRLSERFTSEFSLRGYQVLFHNLIKWFFKRDRNLQGQLAWVICQSGYRLCSDRAAEDGTLIIKQDFDLLFREVAFTSSEDYKPVQPVLGEPLPKEVMEHLWFVESDIHNGGKPRVMCARFRRRAQNWMTNGQWRLFHEYRLASVREDEEGIYQGGGVPAIRTSSFASGFWPFTMLTLQKVTPRLQLVSFGVRMSPDSNSGEVFDIRPANKPVGTELLSVPSQTEMLSQAIGRVL